jgi:ribosomal protein S18 acetylase RimI-like enzyme
MDLQYVKAEKMDAGLLIRLYNESFYDDFVRYGECPAYGRSTEAMEASIEQYPKMIIYSEGTPVGVISVGIRGNGEYYLGCLCVIPSYQGKGIGTQAFRYLLDYYKDWRKITLITPVDKEENVAFYTEKCGFRIDGKEMDGQVKVCHFVMERA